MPEYTSNYNLVKQLPTEYYDREIDNDNLDSIDAKIKEKADIVTTHLDDYTQFKADVVTEPAPNKILKLDSTGKYPAAAISGLVLVKDNFNATTRPTVQNDSSQGYGVGSRWINKTEKTEYLCLDDTVNNALWRLVSGLERVLFYSQGVENVPWIVGYSLGTGSQSKQSDCLLISAAFTTNSGRTYVTQNGIDLTNIKTLKVEWENTAGQGAYFGADANQMADFSGSYLSKAGTFTRQISSFDVSAITGSKFIKVGAGAGSSGNSNVKVYNVWGEQ